MRTAAIDWRHPHPRFQQFPDIAYPGKSRLIISNGVFASLEYSAAPINDTFYGSLGALESLPPSDPATSYLAFEQNGTVLNRPSWINVAAKRDEKGILSFGASENLEHVALVPPDVTVPMVRPPNSQDACNNAILIDEIELGGHSASSRPFKPPTELIIDSISRFNLVPYEVAVEILNLFQDASM
ncbi:hypothetical protein MMC13_001260 [Lambiella insularis]|nr:hypothetical protein [Lambiella insularis]